MNPEKKQVVSEVIIVALFLICGALFFTWKGARSDLALERANISTITTQRDRAAQFFDNFVRVVLRSNGDIDFEARLKLENEARAIGAQEILVKWQAFTKSKTEKEAQIAVIDLLESISNELTGSK